MKSNSSNKINFKVQNGQRIFMPPFGTANVAIEYTPSSLDPKIEEGVVTIENPLVGQWQYNLSGRGVLPSEPKEMNVIAQVNRPTSTTITFKNPFLEAITALVILETESTKGVFSLLNKKAKMQIAPLGSAQIPVSFNPVDMTQHVARIYVTVLPNSGNSIEGGSSASSSAAASNSQTQV